MPFTHYALRCTRYAACQFTVTLCRAIHVYLVTLRTFFVAFARFGSWLFGYYGWLLLRVVGLRLLPLPHLVAVAVTHTCRTDYAFCLPGLVTVRSPAVCVRYRFAVLTGCCGCRSCCRYTAVHVVHTLQYVLTVLFTRLRTLILPILHTGYGSFCRLLRLVAPYHLRTFTVTFTQLPSVTFTVLFTG